MILAFTFAKPGDTMASRRIILFLGMTLFLLKPLCGSGGAVMVVPRSIQSLTQAAEMILTGRVALLRSEWHKDKSVISTRIGVDVEEPLKGPINVGERIEFFQLGGKVGEISSFVAGSPSFKEGENTLLFLSRRRDGTLGLLDLFQGKFSIEDDPASGGRMAVRKIPESQEVMDRIPLDQARAQILGALSR